MTKQPGSSAKNKSRPKAKGAASKKSAVAVPSDGGPGRPDRPDRPDRSANLHFSDNLLAQALFGAHGAHLVQIETELGVGIVTRGGDLTITGSADAVAMAQRVLAELYDRLNRGAEVGPGEVSAVLRMVRQPGVKLSDANLKVHTQRRVISPRSATQAAYLKAIDEHEMVFAIGPAGTGKTYLAVAKGVEMLMRGEVDRIILSRPAVEAGERLGFLPGDLQDKVDPYLRPLYDALYDMLPGDQVTKRLENGDIEVAPLAFMRGRTLSNAFVILDEAQNTTAVQMKMFLTRLGGNARMVVTGDVTQVDLPRGVRSGLRDACDVLDGVKGIAVVEFEASDVVRHAIVTRIVTAYDAAEKRRHTARRYEHDDRENS